MQDKYVLEVLNPRNAMKIEALRRASKRWMEFVLRSFPRSRTAACIW